MTRISIPASSAGTTGGRPCQRMRRRLGMNDLCLLDTHVLLWAVAAPHRLSPGVRALIDKQQYATSVATLWELINKKGKREAPVKDPAVWWDRYVVQPQTPVL